MKECFSFKTALLLELFFPQYVANKILMTKTINAGAKGKIQHNAVAYLLKINNKNLYYETSSCSPKGLGSVA